MRKHDIIPKEVVLNNLYLLRGQTVMLDRDLAVLYGVETKYLKRQVRRNVGRFPDDFMFEMTEKEFQNWRCQIGTSNSEDKMGLRYAPMVFTEHGVAQLSSVINSERAINVNIQIVRFFSRMRKILMNQKDFLIKVNDLENRMGKQDSKIKLIFDYLKQFVKQQKNTKTAIGFKPHNWPKP